MLKFGGKAEAKLAEALVVWGTRGRGEVGSLHAAGQDHSSAVKHPECRIQHDRLPVNKHL